MLDTIALILSIVGCVNWGLVGLCKFDLTDFVSKSMQRFFNLFNGCFGWFSMSGYVVT